MALAHGILDIRDWLLYGSGNRNLSKVQGNMGHSLGTRDPIHVASRSTGEFQINYTHLRMTSGLTGNPDFQAT